MMSNTPGYPHKIFKKIVELLFPVYCVRCATRGAIVCEKCLEHLHTSPSPVGGVLVALAYKDRFVRQALWRLKYKGEKHVAETLASVLFHHVRDRLFEIAEESPLSRDEWLIVGAPSPHERITKRGYNHAELLATSIAEKLGEGHIFESGILEVHKPIVQQAKTTSRAERERNVRGAFRVSEHISVRGKNIVVIDDITTTGATIHECEHTLRRAGAHRILLAAVAH